MAFGSLRPQATVRSNQTDCRILAIYSYALWVGFDTALNFAIWQLN